MEMKSLINKIDENSDLTFQQFQDKSAELNKKTSELGKVLNSFPKGEMGMVKQTPEVKKIKKEFDILFKELQNLNKKYVKIYKKELQKARSEKRRKLQTEESMDVKKLNKKFLGKRISFKDKKGETWVGKATYMGVNPTHGKFQITVGRTPIWPVDVKSIKIQPNPSGKFRKFK